MIKVRIKKQAKARTGYQVQGSLVNDVPAMGGADYNAYIGQPKLRESRYITADPRDQSNVEAEGGEIVYGDINGDNFPESKIIKGPRHAQGGVPLNLPEDTFIYSDTRSMRIKDPEILQMFGKGGSKKSYTPAELAKPYDINKYRVILEDPNSDAVDRKTAELMIKKFVVKLGCLALKQESMKGFPQGIPAVARPCMEAKGLTEQDILPNPELKQLNETIKAEIEKPQQGFSEESMESAEALNQGQPIAEPTQAPTNNPMMEQGPPPSPEEMMRYGGFGRRKLRKGQMGMQQPSQEEMMMQQAGQQIDPEIAQGVQAALEGGAEPMAVIQTLLQGGLDPEMIVNIFVQLGAPQEQAVGLVQQVMQGGGQEQMMAGQPMPAQPMMNYGGANKRKLKEAEYGLSQDPCPDGYYWVPEYQDCVPIPNVPTRDQLFNDPELIDFRNKLNYRRNVQEYKQYRRNKIDEYEQQNYKGPTIKNEEGIITPDWRSPEWEEFKNSNDYKDFKRSLPNPEGWNWDNQLPKEFEQKDYYPESDEWDEKSIYEYNQFFDPDPNDSERKEILIDQYIKERPELNKELKKLKEGSYEDWYKRREQIYDQMPKDEEQTIPIEKVREKRYDDWCPCYQMEDIIVQGVPTQRKVCIPCEQMSMAAYGMSIGGYDMPFYDMPEAAYGMSMGANPNNYMGRRSLPRAQGGIQINVDGMDDAQRRRAIYDAQQANPGKEIIVVEGGSRKRLKQSQFRLPEWDDSQDLQDFPDTDQGKIAAAQYYLIEKNLQNPDVRRELIAETRNALADKKAFRSKSDRGPGTKNYQTIFGDDPMDPAVLSDDQIIQMALKHQKRNYLAQGYDVDPQVFSDTGDRLDDVGTIQTYINPKTERNYTEQEARDIRTKYQNQGWTSVQALSNKIGLDLDESGKDRAVQQATMHGYARMHKKYYNDGYNADPDVKYNLYNFLGNVNMQPAGAGDETSMGELYDDIGNRISPIDDTYTHSAGEGWYDFANRKFTTYGDTTLGHQYIVGVEDYEYEDITDPNCQCTDPNAANYGKRYNQETKQCEGDCNPKTCPCQYPDGKVIEMTPDPNTGECPPCEEDKTIETPGGYAPWWLQDTIKTAGAFGDLMGIRKYMPWSPGVDLEEPRPNYLDPTKELGTNAEQANIQTQGMAQFAGPQALSSRSSSIQGQAAKNAGDILAKYNNANVNIANQFELKATDVRNQESMLRQAAGQRLYDQNTVANQQFDNAKLALRNNLRNYYTNAMTNRWKTDALNQMHPDYAVDPSVGGRMHHTPNSRRPTNTTTNDATDYFKQRERCVQAGAADPDACARNAVQNAMRNSKGGGGNSNMINTMYGNQISVKEGGSIYDNLGYVYFNPLLM
jgi:type II secretory pathway pseudopilin PulG